MGSRAAPLLLLTLALALAGCGDDTPSATATGAAPPRAVPAATAAPDVPADAPVVAFLGDSLAAGMHLPADRAFPAVLQRRLARKDRPFRLVNAGVSGNTTAAGLARVDWILKQAPDVVVVELGANDGFRGLSLEATERNLRAILEAVRARGAVPLLLGMKLPPNYGADYAGRFEALYGRIAEDTGVAYVPFFMDGVAGVREMNLADGIHPTIEGHELLADNLEAPLADLLAEGLRTR